MGDKLYYLQSYIYDFTKYNSEKYGYIISLNIFFKYVRNISQIKLI